MWNENGYFSLVWWTLKLLVLIPINGGPFEPKSKWRKCFQFLTWSLPDAVLLFEWIGFLFFCWSIVWRRKTRDSKCFHYEPTCGFICVFIPFSSTINFHVLEHHQTNNLHDTSFYLVSQFYLSSAFGIPFSPLLLLWFSHFDTI